MSIRFVLVLMTLNVCIAVDAQEVVQRGMAEQSATSHATEMVNLPDHKGNPTSALELNRAGEMRMADHRYSEAESLFKQATKRDPQLTDSLENLALVQLLVGEDADAMQSSSQLLKLDPRNYNGHMSGGIAALNRRQYVYSLNRLKGLLAQTEDPLILAAAEIDERALGHQAVAQSIKARLATHTISSKDAVLAAQVFRLPEFDGYLEQWLLLAERNEPDSFPIKNILVQFYERRGNYGQADKVARQALALRPESVMAMLNLYDIARASNDNVGAKNALLQAKQRPKNDVPSLIRFAKICVQRRMFFDSKDALQQVVEMEPDNSSAHFLLGLSLYNLGLTNDSEQHLRMAVALQPFYQPARTALGYLLLSTSRQSEARALFEAILSGDPKQAPAHYYLGQITRETGDLAAAEHHLKRAIELAPGEARSYAELGQVQILQHKNAEAFTNVQKALALDPRSANAHFQMGTLLRREGNIDESKKEFAFFEEYRGEVKTQAIQALVADESELPKGYEHKRQ